MVEVISPKVQIVGFGPSMHIVDSQITPDEFVYGAAQVTYRDMNALTEFLALASEKDTSEKVKQGLIKVAGSGHASMATTPGFWAIIGGNSSKFIDSIFTGARFGSSLMPSGRRVPINEESILVPKGIRENSPLAERLYFETSQRNIKVYQEMQTRGVSTQEASKIVQYGHKGGGFVFMPLETLVYFAKEAEANPDSMPLEGREIIAQFEDFVHAKGMGTTYEARKAAPRTGCPNPNIFHNRYNLTEDVLKKRPSVLDNSILLDERVDESWRRDLRIGNYLKRRKEVFQSPEKISKEWRSLLRELEEVVTDYNDSVRFKVASNIPWRVWGEVKRHRTLPQTTESVYNAVKRASTELERGRETLDYESILSIPDSVKNDALNLVMWTEAFSDSISCYNQLLQLCVKESDAIAVVPRGLKMINIKEFDFYNLTLGYGSLRLCKTAEPEMREITKREMDLVTSNLPDGISRLVFPKCGYVGFCPETKHCGNVVSLVSSYNGDFHKQLNSERADHIERRLR